ncbi:MAG: VWA domain-containing protein [Bacteroidales bacterium]|nr:VWA domain-containing protein [Bacteroidales bacterium]
MPENFELANMWVFWLLPLPLLVYWLLPPLRMKSSSLSIPNFQKAQAYTGQPPRSSALVKRRNTFVWIGLILIWVLLLSALSSPQLVGKPEMKVKTSRNFLIVADISFSMAQSDWMIEGEKATRWEAVKKVMHDFIARREGDRMGLIFFGSSAYIQAPFTPDLVTVENMLEEAGVGMAGQMTNIGKAIVKGIEMFAQDTIKTKIMLVLSDGVDAGTDILPLDAADLAEKDSILVYTIGIGDPDKPGSDLDEKTLEEIAEMTGAQYFRAIDAERLEEIYEELDKLEPIEYEEEKYKPTTLLYYYPLGASIVLGLFLSFILSSISAIKRLVNKRKMHG